MAGRFLNTLEEENLSIIQVAIHLEASIYVNNLDNKTDDSAYIQQRLTASM